MTHDAIPPPPREPGTSESRRDSWAPRLPTWLTSALIGAAGFLLPAIAVGLVAWGALTERAAAEAEKLEAQVERISVLADTEDTRHELTVGRMGALEVRQAELAAQYDALKVGQAEIKESLRRLEDRFGTRRGRDRDD